MSLDQEKLQSVLEKLMISDGKHSEYNAMAVEKENWIVKELSKFWGATFNGLSVKGTYLDRAKWKTCDEFDLHLKLKLPFPITPRKDDKGFVFLYAGIYKHEIVVDNYVNRKRLNDWFLSKLQSFKSYNNNFQYTANENGRTHTLKYIQSNIDISFDLVPAFQFTWDQLPLDLDLPPISAEVGSDMLWLAVPHTKRGSSGDERTFMVCSPHYEREATKDLKNFNNVLRLMKGVRDAHVDDFPQLSSYMLKTVLLHQLGRVDWNSDLATLFLEMWSCLVDHLNSGHMDFFLSKGNNIFDDMQCREFHECRISAERLLADFKNAASYNSLWLHRTFNV
ncbi:uncharacterized protein LOC117902800 [Drosophila subobscura]|uniref:uncharacterized protein LOC117902800 n=1 Tax=Drosophila subobscura TaxID=7241 RepID=UPI00155B384A|nr:uncharacterized protein LOC117902800 [Drosophila subobscura]XP_034670312.1 uncharacterized protein LOC117902800 [Drosophila subobscura]